MLDGVELGEASDHDDGGWLYAPFSSRSSPTFPRRSSIALSRARISAIGRHLQSLAASPLRCVNVVGMDWGHSCFG